MQAGIFRAGILPVFHSRSQEKLLAGWERSSLAPAAFPAIPGERLRECPLNESTQIYIMGRSGADDHRG